MAARPFRVKESRPRHFLSRRDFDVLDLSIRLANPAAFGGYLAAGIFAGILVALLVGRKLGKRTVARFGAGGTPSVGSLEAAVFALMGLLIAFTFSGALNRFDQRRAQIVDEANAVGTASNSPGLLSGNVIQIPIHVPINACGNSINLIGLLNPTAGNVCTNS